uniref:Uncharacterized protein n=1 Tax=Avena sativa TaxID=4498 RepID=A0ACD5WKF4_AVESA
MLKWVWRILRDDGGLWLQLIKAKYLRGRPLLACDRREGSQFWRSIQDIKHYIGRGISFVAGDGQGVRFWLDPWLFPVPLGIQFPALFAISASPSSLVAENFRDGLWNPLFRRTFNGVEAAELQSLMGALPMALSQGKDVAAWLLLPSGEFSVSSAYKALFQGPARTWSGPLWEAPLPLSIRIFVWQLLRDRLPSGVEVSKRNGPGDGRCPLCGTPESCSHIMFSCLAARFLWNFVQEALGPTWQAQELGEFLQAQANRTGGGRRLFWLLFAALSWTLWNVRNKMVIERISPPGRLTQFFLCLPSSSSGPPWCARVIAPRSSLRSGRCALRPSPSRHRRRLRPRPPRRPDGRHLSWFPSFFGFFFGL